MLLASLISLPKSSWDTHVHVLDPIGHPYIPDAPYAPSRARSVHELVAACPTDNFVITMSAPEGTQTALTEKSIAQLGEMGRTARGTVVLNPPELTIDEIRRLHAAGVRSVRINTKTVGNDVESLADLWSDVARRIHAAGRSWAIDGAIFDPRVWLGLLPTLRRLHEVYGTVFVADHILALQPSDAGSELFTRLLEAVDEAIIIVKISGLTRLGRSAQTLLPTIRAVLEQRQGSGAVWGSDWPYLDSAPGATGFHDVDQQQHLCMLKQVCDQVGAGVWEKLMRDNAAALYG